MLSGLLHRLMHLSGWRRYAAACGAGAVMTLALPPAGFFPVLVFCVPAFLFFARTAETKKQAFATGWAFGCGFFIAGLYWVSIALFVDIAAWFWVLPLSLVAGPAVLALYYGFLPLAAWPLRRNKTAHACAMIAAWGAVEWLRGHALTGFPWNLAGYAWAHVLPVMQINAYAGIYGLTLLTLLWAALPAMLPVRRCAFFMTVLFGMAYAAGALRLAAVPLTDTGQVVRIVQANIPQTAKWDRESAIRNLETHMRLSQQHLPADAVIWPETAVATDISRYPQLAQNIAAHLPENSTLVLGSIRVTPRPDKKEDDFHNSIVALAQNNSTVAAHYDKHHLVPFGEYIPFRDQLEMTPLALAVSGIGSFAAGSGPQTLSVEGLPPFSPLVCYEVIFPRAVTNKNTRPAWMVNVTNDGWYGRSRSEERR